MLNSGSSIHDMLNPANLTDLILPGAEDVQKTKMYLSDCPFIELPTAGPSSEVCGQPVCCGR